MKKLLALAVIALLGGCSTTYVVLPDGKNQPMTPADAQWVRKFAANPEALDINGPAPSVFYDTARPHCGENGAFLMFPSRIYWALRGAPSLAGYSDQQLAAVQIEACKANKK